MSYESETAILLDIDGVVFPTEYDATLPEEGPNKHLERRYLNDHEFYHPEIIAALAKVTMRATVLLASSRQTGFLTPSYREIVDTLAIKGALRIDTHNPIRIELKYDAVRRFMHHTGDTGLKIYEKGRGSVFNGSGVKLPIAAERAVWVDDDIKMIGYSGSAEAMRREDELLGDEKIEIVMPESKMGLTLEDVESIRAFLR